MIEPTSRPPAPAPTAEPAAAPPPSSAPMIWAPAPPPMTPAMVLPIGPRLICLTSEPTTLPPIPPAISWIMSPTIPPHMDVLLIWVDRQSIFSHGFRKNPPGIRKYSRQTLSIVCESAHFWMVSTARRSLIPIRNKIPARRAPSGRFAIWRSGALPVANLGAGPALDDLDQRGKIGLAEPLILPEPPELADGFQDPHRHPKRAGFLQAERDVLDHGGKVGAVVECAGQHRAGHFIQGGAVTAGGDVDDVHHLACIQSAFGAQHQCLERRCHVGSADQVVDQLHQLCLPRAVPNLEDVADAVQPRPNFGQCGFRP